MIKPSALAVLALSIKGIQAGEAGSIPDCDNGPLKSHKVCDTTASPRERASALVASLQPEEKLANLVSKAQGAPRIGLPAYNWWSEALHGVAGAPGINFGGDFGNATSFPMPLLMAAAFDDDLIEKVGTVIGIEARAFGNSNHSGIDYWTPDINPFRDPRWGRGSETPGEDITRIKGYTAKFLRGLEGDDPKERRIIATCKHLAGYDMEAWGGVTRHSFDAKISTQELAEYYMQPFQQCARDSKVGSIMCSYNALNGVPTCANSYLMDTILRDHWNWTESNNYITSDCEAVADVSVNHHFAATNAEGTAMCFNAGMDTSCEYSGSSDIPGAWKSGALNETTVDRALTRLYEGLVRAGYFDGKKAVYASLGAKDLNTPEAQRLALQAAADGIVMLKNDGTLPLKKQSTKLAMVGFWADDQKKLQGGYSGKAPYLHTPVYAAQQLGYTVNVAGGPILQTTAAKDNWTDDAVAAAKKSDVILYFGGLDTSAAGEESDRTSIAWPGAQLALLQKLAALKKPIVVIQLGDQVDNTPLLAKGSGINSILWANWPGQEGGPAVMSIITGAKAPAGRLPVTQYPASYADAVPMTDMSLRPTGTLPGRTYRWYNAAVQPFGYGLHYTSFKTSFDKGSFKTVIDIQDVLSKCDKAYPDTCPLPSLPVVVKNTGKTTSDYVALAFVADADDKKKKENGGADLGPQPIKTLVAYGRLRDIKAGQTATKSLDWTIGHLAKHDKDGNTVIYPGKYRLMLDQPTQTTVEITVKGKMVVLDQWPAPPAAPA
ncbi:beta-xylosidase [Xylariaceae sp. FL0594]|nr:beta-xylosidase [Xylariaceae sp. FL0594]